MGRAVQVVRLVTNQDEGATCLELDEDALREVLIQDSVQDLPIVVVSVAGRMRQGKSFLLNYLILYLKNKGLGTWMEGTDDRSLGGFQWRDGPVACTTGILVWSEVFVLEGPGGKQVAVLLMDTQGTFDIDTTMQECSTVFALSTMLSSVQIYNVMRDVKRDDLDSLQLFVEFAKAASSQVTPFKSLEFLIRDWQWPESHQLGATGGAEYIDRKLKNAPEVSSCFEQVSCFLLPYPWNMVEGQPLGLSATFISHLKDFFPNMLAWDKLQSRIKYVDGETIKTKDILTHFKVFVDIFQENKLPSPQSMFDANVHIALTKAYEIGILTFEGTRKVITEDNIDEATPAQDPVALEQSLLQCQALAVQEFEGRATLGASRRVTDCYLTKLEKDTETIICALLELNLSKKRNEEAVRFREECEREEKMAGKKQRVAERARDKAEETLQRVKKEKEEAEAKRREAGRRGEELDETHKILKMQLEAMMRRARQDLEEAEERRRETERIKEEAERRRSEAEQQGGQSGSSTRNMIVTFGQILCDVIHVAAVVADTMSYTTSPQRGRSRTRRSRRPRARR